MAFEETVSYFVRYRDLPGPVEAFAADYNGRHVDILRTWPGIQRIVVHTPVTWHDPQGIRPDATDFLTEMTFASSDALHAALESEARARARDDRVNLKQGAALVTHQAMRSLRLL